jgi:RHS repeat-associated protein
MNAKQQIISGNYGSNLNIASGYDVYGFPTSTVVDSIQNYSYNFNTITGNLNWRQNNIYQNLREDFIYDDLDRLDSVILADTTTLDMAYDNQKGGITYKSDAGTLSYENSNKPYAVSNIDPVSSFTLLTEQNITYTSFESVKTISEGDYSASFLYGSDNERSRMVVQQDSNIFLIRWYLSSNYIKETIGSITREYTFIGGDAYSAPVVAITQNEATTYYYLLRDYLGNITHIVNSASDTVVAEYSFDAWGRTRNPSTWINDSLGITTSFFVAGRGFTGHEHLPWFNSINMNGRVYDPLIGMFLSPDNYVQNSDFTQNFNRYLYAFNNPLKYTDINGE